MIDTTTRKRCGDIQTVNRIRRWRTCHECGLPAKYRITFLLTNARANPASTAYRHDDCSWCSDSDTYACESHRKIIEHKPTEGFKWCSTFALKKFLHMGFYWELI